MLGEFQPETQPASAVAQAWLGAKIDMRALVATWDGAGNLPPIAALIEALVGRGHEVHAIGHDVQQKQIVAAGARFHRYETVPQWDVGVRGWLGDDDPISKFAKLAETTGADVPALAARLKPDVALIDCMLPSALTLARQSGLKTVALVHTVYSFFEEFAGGVCKGPIDAADLALGMSYAAFDQGAGFPPNLVFVGPLRPDIAATPRARRTKDRPFVVVSLSTGYQTPGQLDLLQRICEAVRALDAEVLVTTGRGISPEELSAGPNTTVERRVPHDAVLPGAALLITHGGHGTIMAGLRYGVPMLCLPPAADQPFNARKVEELRLGAVLDPGASIDEIRTGVSRMLADGSLRERVQAFSVGVAAEPGVTTAIERIEALVA